MYQYGEESPEANTLALLPTLYGKLNSLYESSIQQIEIADAAKELASYATQKQYAYQSISVWAHCFDRADNNNEHCICLFYTLHDVLTKRLKSTYIEDQFLQLEYIYMFIATLAPRLAMLKTRRLYIAIDRIARCLSLWKEKGVLELPVMYLLEVVLKGTNDQRQDACDKLILLCDEEIINQFPLNGKHIQLQELNRFTRDQEDAATMEKALNQKLLWLHHFSDLCPLLMYPLSLTNKPKIRYFMSEGTDIEEVYENINLHDDSHFQSLMREHFKVESYEETISPADSKYLTGLRTQTEILYKYIMKLSSRLRYLNKNSDRDAAAIDAIYTKLEASRDQINVTATSLINILDNRICELLYRSYKLHRLENFIGDL